MYLEHFRLRHQPFSEHAAATSLWQDARMDEGLARLEYLVSQGLLGLLTGPSGVGKSALLKRFLQGLAPQRCEVVYCHPTSRSCRPVATPEPSTTRSSRSFTTLPAASRDTSTIWRPPACCKPRLAS